MTTATFTAAPAISTATQFRDWGSKFAAALGTVGLVKTADTGQIDWVTVSAPTGTQTMGYEMWRFNDTAQATYPLFVKFSYGSVSSAPGITVAIGKGSNGTGTLTGQIMSVQVNTTTTNASPSTWYVSSGDGSALCFAMAPALTAAGSGGWAAIERARTAADVPQGEALWAIAQTGSTRAITVGNYASATNNTTNFAGGLPVPTTSDVSLAFSGGPAPTTAYVLWDGSQTMWQGRAALLGMRADFAALAPFTITGWGTYLPLGAASQTSSSDYRVYAIRWS